MGRILTNALLRFEHRVLALLEEAGHREVRLSQLNLTRNLDLAGTRVTELAKRAGISKQAMSEIVLQCETAGLVFRSPDALDARAKIVAFTPAGREWLAAFRAALDTAEQEMRAELGYLAVNAIAAALTRYGHDFDQLSSPDHLTEDSPTREQVVSSPD